MNYSPTDLYVWDAWYMAVDDQVHAYHLARKRGAANVAADVENSLGHAVTRDLVHWEQRPPAFGPDPANPLDDRQPWTGCAVWHEGRGYLYYTMRGSADQCRIQRIGLATSADGEHWQRHAGNPIIVPDPRWYATDQAPVPRIVDCRDLIVIPDPKGGWLGFYATRIPGSPGRRRGEPGGELPQTAAIACVRSPDLLRWEHLPPAFAPGGPFNVRVSIDRRPRLDKIAGWDGGTLGTIAGLTVGRDGEVYVLLSDGYGFWGRSELRVLDRNGKYLRTIIPYPANLPAKATAPVGQLEIEAERLPIVFNGHGHNLSPLTAGMKKQTMVFNPKGRLLMVSAVGTMAEHGSPRHLLAVAPEGGAPEGVGFVGPQIRPPGGFMGGSGEGGVWFFDHLATSPDGEWIYFVPFKLDDKNARHAVFRLKWTDKALGAPFLGKDKEPGNDDAHFSNPQGLATDRDGNLYVCDQGNGRIVCFAPDGKLLRKFMAESPEQIALTPKGDVMYVVLRKPGKKELSKLLKLSISGKGEAREVARLDKSIDLIALDVTSSPSKLWAAMKGKLAPVLDKGEALELGEPIGSDAGLDYPMFIAADPARNRVLIREKSATRMPVFTLDLATGKKQPFLKGQDPALDREGNVYVMDGYGTNSLSRYTPDGKPLPFPGAGSNKIDTGPYRGYGPNIGLQGHCVALNGDIYVVRGSNYGGVGCFGGRIDVFGPDGKLKKGGLIDGRGYGDCGVGVDPAGNVYVGANVKPRDKPFPQAFMGKVPAKGWTWWKQPREAPWSYTYYNAYLFHWGSVLKFPPAGGAFYGHPWEGEKVEQAPPTFSVAGAPAGAASYRSAYLGREVKVAGALWRYGGFGIIPSSSDGLLPDPGCVCHNARLAVDEYGRVFVPNVFRFSVEMLDTNGNQLSRIGRYGNTDSAGPGSKVPEPEIAFAWPAFVSAAGGKLYVSDSVNRRVVVVRFEPSAAEECELPAGKSP